MAGAISVPRRERPSRRTFSRQEVVSTALAIIDRDGLDALSMRGLADELGTYPTSLYWHAGTKAQLLALVCQEALSTVVLPDESDLNWQEWIIALGRELRNAFMQHPNLITYFTAQMQVSTASFEIAERVLAALSRAGFSGPSLVHAYNTTLATIVGWLGSEFADDPRGAPDDWQAFFRQQLDETENVPTIRTHLDALRNHALMLRWESGRTNPLHESFEFMLSTLVAGLAIMAQKSPHDEPGVGA